MRALRIVTIPLLTILMAGCGNKTREANRPNVIVIMADDMGFSDIGSYGGEISTPALDNLASEGIRFTQFYNNARCCPSRAALLTGLYPHQTGLGGMVDGVIRDGGYSGEISRNTVTIAEALGEAGYKSYMSGKWHVSRSSTPDDKSNWPLQRGFDRYFGTITGAGSFYDPGTLTWMNDPVKATPGFYYTDAISDSAAMFINDHGKTGKDDPFFLYVAYTAPHWPLHAPEEVINKYEDLYSAGWDRLREERMIRLKESGIIGEDIVLSERDRRVLPWDSVPEKEWQVRRMATYAAMVEIMDQGIGRIVEALENNGMKENTLVFFLSDNGGCAEGWNMQTEWIRRYGPTHTFDGVEVRFGNDPSIMPGPDSTYTSYSTEWANLSNTPFRWYKHYGHEGGVASPLIMNWPEGLNEGNALRRQVSGIIDIMATILEVTGADYPELYNGNAIIPIEGVSLFGAAADNKPIDREALYFEHEGNRYIRKGEWKLVSLGNREWELYDMEKDRSETNNLAADYPQLVKEMKDEWERWAWRTGVLPKPR